MFDSSRGQAYTLEGVIAALIIASSVLVGLQAVDKTPWTTGSSDVISEQRQTQAADLLAVTHEDGSMPRAITCVDDAGDLSSAVVGLTEFGQTVNDTLASRGFSFRLSVAYWNASGEREIEVIAGGGASPNSDAVTATRRVTLTDDMKSYDINSVNPICEPRDETLAEDSDFYIPDVNSSSEVYNVAEVRLDVWSTEET